jgi:hypothetical protein
MFKTLNPADASTPMSKMMNVIYLLAAIASALYVGLGGEKPIPMCSCAACEEKLKVCEASLDECTSELNAPVVEEVSP